MGHGHLWARTPSSESVLCAGSLQPAVPSSPLFPPARCSLQPAVPSSPLFPPARCSPSPRCSPAPRGQEPCHPFGTVWDLFPVGSGAPSSKQSILGSRLGEQSPPPCRGLVLQGGDAKLHSLPPPPPPPSLVSTVRSVGGRLGHLERLHYLLLLGSGGPLKGELSHGKFTQTEGILARARRHWRCLLVYRAAPQWWQRLGVFMVLSLAP